MSEALDLTTPCASKHDGPYPWSPIAMAVPLSLLALASPVYFEEVGGRHELVPMRTRLSVKGRMLLTAYHASADPLGAKRAM